MSSLEQDDAASNENGSVKRRTRSGRATKSPAPTPKSTRSKKQTQKPIFEDTEDLKEMSRGLDSFFAQEDAEDFEMPASDGNEQPLKNDSPNANISRALGEESNGSMDGMLKTCFEDNIIQTEGDVQSIPIEPMDVSIADSTEDSENVPLEFDNMNQDVMNFAEESNEKETPDSDIEEVVENNSEVEAVEEHENSEEVEIIDVNKDTIDDQSEYFEEPVPDVVEELEKSETIVRKGDTDDDKSNDSKKVEKIETAVQEDETEVVSEDELPGIEKPEVKDAENVSDDELPGPKPADLPADTEVVSEDELPSSKKESSSRKRKAGSNAESGYDPGSPTSEGESTAKKQAVVKDGENKLQSGEKKSSEEKAAKKKALPELDKYWKAVNDDATDFTGWTYLLQYVDQENDVEAAREAYDAFLSHYPYCYGYWRKYADYEKRKGSKKKCLEVLERGLRGIPLSVDLWIHYLNHVKSTRADEHDHIRQQYERAIGACGLEFRSDRLWESFIKWEGEHGTFLNVTTLYDKLLATPTLGYTSHFDNFQEHILANPPHACVPVEEFVRLRGEIRAEMKNDPPLDSDPDIPPGEEETDDHIRSEEEGNAIKERIVTIRRKVHKITVEQVAQRWNFEEGIKRPYFHVKPLERCQLKNWKAYLEWEEQQQDQVRTLVLYERCLIACALYEDFWLRLVQYLERCTAAETDETERATLVARTRDVLERACTIHHVERPALHAHWATFEERHGAAARAADILERLDKACPNLLQVACRRINLERRRGDLEKCCQLYEQYISQSKSKGVASSLSIKYARFLHRVRRDPAAACAVLRTQTGRDPTCQRLYLQMMDIALLGTENNLQEAIGYIDEYLAVEGIDNESKLVFMQRKSELLEEFGDSIAEIQGALLAYQVLAKQQHKKKNKEKNSSNDNTNSNSSKKKSDAAIAPPLPPTAPTNNTAMSGYGTTSYGSGTPSQGQAPAQQQQQQYEGGPGYPQQQYHQWGPPYHHPSQYHHNPWNPYPNYY